MKILNAVAQEDGKIVKLAWDTGQVARFHAIWLRDNALDSDTRSSVNGQRLITVQDIPEDICITAVSISDTDELMVTMAPEMKEISFPSEWLLENAYDGVPSVGEEFVSKTVETWDANFQNHMPTATWQDVSCSDVSLMNWLDAVRKYGFAVLTGISDQSGALCEVAEKFGYVRETNYGRWFEVRSEVNPQNLAYTNLGLQAHTDNPYREPVPTLQLLSCLENTVKGGESIVVDGFKVAEIIKEKTPEAFDLLAKYSFNFEYTGAEDVCLRATRPTIELTPEGEIKSVSFNNRSSAPIQTVPFEHMEDFYAAYRLFGELVEDPAMQVSFKLSPGELFIVDNTRVMHARKAFSGSGNRWLQGCYADKDGLLSTLSILEARRTGGV